MKGISPLVATVLLIGIAIGVGGLIAAWVTSFTKTSSEIVRKESELQIICSNGAIDITSLKFCNNYLSAIVKNNGRIVIGNITLQVIFQNISLLTVDLNDTAGNPLSLKPGQLATFNQSIGGSNYDKIWIFTNCTGVTDLAERSDVVAC